MPLSSETWAGVAQELFLETYEQYLAFITDPQLRTKIRQLAEKRRYTPFKGNSGRHQSLIHINTLYRLGLVDYTKVGQGRAYFAKQLPERKRAATSELLAAIPDVKALQQIIETGSLYDVVGRVLGIQLKSGLVSDKEFGRRVRSLYAQVLKTGVSLCSLQTLYEALQIESLTHDMRPEPYPAFVARLRALQNKAPSQIRFHVDRYGYPAFLKMGLAD